jgi:uncharacterized protein with FMN-binding domain
MMYYFRNYLTRRLCAATLLGLAWYGLHADGGDPQSTSSLSVRLVKQTTSKKSTTKTKPQSTPDTTIATTTVKSRTKTEVEALINKEGKTPPPWFDETPLDYPKTLNLDWPEKPGAWNNQVNVGQYIWDVINPNPSKWREGVRLMHHILKINGKDKGVVKRACGTLGHLYGDCMEDYARSAFWYRLAGGNDLNLAHCYWKLDSKSMAEAILKQYSNDNSRHGTVIRLWAEMGETDIALKMAEKASRTSHPDSGFLVLGDIYRLTGRYSEALKAYQKVVDAKTGSGDLAKNQGRARSNIEAIKVFETLDLKKIVDGSYRQKSLGYEADVEVEVSVKSGKIEKVQVTQHREKQYYSAFTDTTRQIIDRQGVKGVDATSRATITSEAVINATAKALASGLK